MGTPDGVRFRIGLWSAEKERSNYTELKNLVDSTEEEARVGRLSNCVFSCAQIMPLPMQHFISAALPTYCYMHWSYTSSLLTPWSLKRASVLMDVGGRLCVVIKTGEDDGENILRKLLLLPRRISTVSAGGSW